MQRRRSFVFLLMLLCGRGAQADHVLTVGVLALRPLAEAQARWQPLAKYLSDALPGHQVQVRALDYPGLARALDIHAFTIPANYTGAEDLALKLRLPPYDSDPHFTLADVWARYRISILLLLAAAGIILTLTTRLLTSRHRLTAARRLSEQQASALSRSYAHLHTLVETIPDLVWLKDPQGVFLACNPRFERLFNAPESEIVGKTDDAFVPPELAEFFREKDREAIAAGKPCTNEEWVTFADNGQRALLETIKTPMRDATGNLVGVLGIARDITVRRADEERLRFLARVVENAGETFMVTDTRGIIVAVNPAFTRITGYDTSEALGQTPAMLKSGRQDNEFYRGLWTALRHDGLWEGEIWDRRKDATIYPKWLSITTVRDESGQASHYVAAFTDISDRKAVEERIHNLAFYDPLTALPNRRLLMDRLEHALLASTRSRQHGALLFLDLDHFKTLNDTQGHAIGDQLLIEIGKRLTGCMRDMDTVSRLGGDEFVVLIEGLGRDETGAVKQAEIIAEKVHACLNLPYSLKGVDLGYHSSASIGVTLFCGQDTSLDTLFKQADMAMYQAKDAGRNAIRFFNPAMQAAIESRAAMETALRRGLEQDELHLYYQPQVDIRGTWIGAEALLRWLPPGPQSDTPGRVHSAGRGNRTHPAHRPSGAASCLRPTQGLGCFGGDAPSGAGGERQRPPVSPARLRRRRGANPGRERRRPDAIEAGTHRKRRARQRGGSHRPHGQPQGAGDRPVAG